MLEKNNYIILGAGLSGLSLANYLKNNYKILEASNSSGGLCKSFSKDNFIYDIGGHILFSKDQDILGELINFLEKNINLKKRNNQIFYKNLFVKYPFENGLYALDKQEIFECLETFLNRPNIKCNNLYDWAINRFGTGISKKYLLPYNKKIWKRDVNKISLHWVDRIPSPPLTDILKSCIGIETEGYTHQLNFYYPKNGGIQALTDNLTKKIKNIIYNFRVNKIIKKNKEWAIYSDNNKVDYCEKLISTIPVFDLVNSLEKVPEKVLKALNSLEYNSMYVVFIGLKDLNLNQKTAIYIPDTEILPHRVCFMNAFSQYCSPENSSSVMAEITFDPKHKLNIDKNSLIEKVIGQIKDICDFKINNIVTTDIQEIKYSYVVYDLNYLKNRKIVFDYLDSLGIYTLGRFGNFEYINMDTCVFNAKKLWEKINS